jgi:hypothetical protein
MLLEEEKAEAVWSETVFSERSEGYSSEVIYIQGVLHEEICLHDCFVGV